MSTYRVSFTDVNGHTCDQRDIEADDETQAEEQANDLLETEYPHGTEICDIQFLA